MRVSILVGAEAAYACIRSLGHDMDVRLSPGRPAAQSLRETAEEMRQQAARLQQRAMIITEAAYQLDEDERAGRKYASR